MIMRNSFQPNTWNRASLMAVMAFGLMLAALADGVAAAAETVFTPLINARSISSLLELNGVLLGGLDEGGLVVWNADDPSDPQRIFAGDQLSGNQVSDLAWTGRYVWVATRDGGLTRIDGVGGEMAFRQYSSNLGSLNLNAVTGEVIAGSERVFYAMDGAGIGRIVDGLPGNLYTAEQDGLIDNDVNALQLFQGDLFVATPSGISRFADNAFTDQNTGLTDPIVNDLALDADGNLLAAGNGGVFRWNPTTSAWTYIGGTGSWVNRLATGPGGVFALGITASGNVLSRYDGATWTSLPLPYTRTYAVFAGLDLWVGGRIVDTGMALQTGHGWLGRQNTGGGFTTWRLDAPLVRNATGVTYGLDGSPWIGSHNADAISHLAGGAWNSIYAVATAGNDSSGLFNQGANILSLTTGTDGTIYAGQYTSGVVRIDPATGTSELMYAANCGLEGGNIVNMITHPDGPVIFMHDWANAQKVEVLVDTDHWRNPASWVLPPTGEGGLGTGPSVWDALVERRDVIWFAVEGTGLVRWDVNGDLAGPNDPLTWLDTSDDRWDEPLASFTGTSNSPTEAFALALAADGSIWVGGNGVVRFTYNDFTRTATVQEHFSEKTSPFGDGLINGNVADLALDAEGALWVATRAGLNRGITSAGETAFTAWFDLANYLSNNNYALLYSPDSIDLLPGGLYRKIVADPAGETLLLSSDRGAVLIEPGSAGPVTSESGLSAAFLYPNPFNPGEGEGLLKLGGLAADALNGDPAQVTIYNVEGQLVYENNYVSAGVGFWDGRNIYLQRNNAAAGMYVVRITFRDQTTVRPLAVVR